MTMGCTKSIFLYVHLMLNADTILILEEVDLHSWNNGAVKSYEKLFLGSFCKIQIWCCRQQKFEEASSMHHQ